MLKLFLAAAFVGAGIIFGIGLGIYGMAKCIDAWASNFR